MKNIRLFCYCLTFIVLSLLLMTLQAHSQSHSHAEKRFHFGFSAEAGRLLGEPGKNYKNGLGGNLLAAYTLQDEVQITFSAGYLHFRGKSFEDDYFVYSIDDWKSIPLRLGGKYFATPHIFLKLETGAVFFMEPGRGTSFILGPGAGLQLGHFEAVLKLETWTDGGTVSFAGFSLGYFF